LKLHLSNISGINLFTGYGEGYVMVNKQRYAHNLVVLRDRLVTDWQPAGFDDLSAADLLLPSLGDPEAPLDPGAAGKVGAPFLGLGELERLKSSRAATHTA